VHRHFLCRDSPILNDMVQRTASGTNSVLTLDNVTKEEFQHLLWMYYKPHEIETETDDEVPPVVWRDILKLADLWQMTRIKDIAVESWMKTELDPAVRITLCERPDVERSRARDAYMKICTREAPLTAGEMKILGTDLFLRIMETRERIIALRQVPTQPGAVEEMVEDALIIGSYYWPRVAE
ncbi:hypothetical protein DFH09DRAFT_948141, partial [Mycena vulgaris]